MLISAKQLNLTAKSFVSEVRKDYDRTIFHRLQESLHLWHYSNPATTFMPLKILN